MKTIPTFEFIDEPQFRTPMSRAEAAHRLRSYRNRENSNFKRYTVSKASNGYLVSLNCYNSPVALIITK
jgi:hypothetical protein